MCSALCVSYSVCSLGVSVARCALYGVLCDLNVRFGASCSVRCQLLGVVLTPLCGVNCTVLCQLLCGVGCFVWCQLLCVVSVALCGVGCSRGVSCSVSCQLLCVVSVALFSAT